MAKLVAADIMPHILQYLNAGETGPTAAIEATRSRYGIKKLVRPDLLAKLKHMKTALSNEQIPAIVEEILTILEALAQMDQDSTSPHIPQDILVHIFRALKLCLPEQRDVIGLVTAERATIEEVKQFVNDRMIFYSLWTRTFLKADQDHHASTGYQPRRTQAGGALGGELKCKSKRMNRKKRQEGSDGADRGEDKSVSGAGFERKGGAGKGEQGPKPVSYVRLICASRPQAKPWGPDTGRTAAHYLVLARNLNLKQRMFFGGVCVIWVQTQSNMPAPTGSEEKTCFAASAKQTRKYVWPRPAMCRPPSTQLSMARHWKATAS